MLNECGSEFDEKQKEIEKFVKDNVFEKWKQFPFENVKFVKDDNPNGLGSVETIFNVRLAIENIIQKIKDVNIDLDKCLKCIAIHECFHKIFSELYQTPEIIDDSFRYKKSENLTWDYVEREFPNFKQTIDKLRNIY